MGLKFIDISSHQSTSTAGMDGIDGVIVKATQGTTYVNPKCDPQYQLAKSKGRLLGVYHYAAGGNPEAEADYFIKNIQGYLKEAVPALDWEAGSNASWGSTTWAERFVNRFHDKTGVWPLLYTNLEGIKQCKSLVNRCGLWFAGWPTNGPGWNVPNFNYNISPWTAYTLWQFTSQNETLDLNIGNISKEGWKAIAKGGAAEPENPTKPEQPSTSYSTSGKTLEGMASDVLAGKVGDGDVRKTNLGAYYKSVQAIVNQRSGGTSTEAVNVLTNEVLAGRLGNGDERKRLLGTYYTPVQDKINSKSSGGSARVYTVQNGDTLTGIGVKLGVAWTGIASANGIKPPYVIRPGQKLKY